MTATVKAPKKLIEVALPLDAINEAAKDEKAVPRRGHPQTLHYWWARRPLAAARAVIFAQMINDPSWKWEMEHPGELPSANLKASWAASRKRLFSIIEDMVKWENTNNDTIIERARAEIKKSWRETCEINKEHPQAAELFNPEKLPTFHDAFAGGGALPLEAQRLGLKVYASDLNPVAVLINKAMIEIPPMFAGLPPVNQEARNSRDAWSKQWTGAQGLAEDVRHYGQWMRDEAQKRIGNLYPYVEITGEMARERPDLKPLVGQKLTVIAWQWARTVRSPNPAFSHVDVPLASTFILSGKLGKEVYVDPVVDGDRYRFTVKVGLPPAEARNGTKLSRGANFRCLLSGAPIEPKYIKSEGRAGRMGARLMAIVAEGIKGRVYIEPSIGAEAAAQDATPSWTPETPLPNDPRNFWTVDYGLTTYGDLFSPRQLVALTTFSNLVSEVRERVEQDAVAAGMPDSNIALEAGGLGAHAYAEAVAVYLGCALSRLATYNNTICVWNIKGGSVAQIFARQAIPMSWDFMEINPLEKMSGNWLGGVDWIADVLSTLRSSTRCFALQHDARQDIGVSAKIISTDPPYYDNISYADLSDLFYIWLRRSLRGVFSNLFVTMSVPKSDEIVASPYRHGNKEAAEKYFLDGMSLAISTQLNSAHSAFPITIYYAFKQSESSNDVGTSSTGWETFLEALLRSNLSLVGTWPMRTERDSGVKAGNNVLASSVVLVCRPREPGAGTISRRAFLRELNQVLPEALDEMTRGAGDDRSPVAPVDLSQAIIGPGMAVFSKYAAVLEADGTPMTVQTALRLINRFLAEDDFDHDTQFCLHWFEQYGWKEGRFGEADTLARAKGTSVDGVKHSGVLFATGGIVRLLKWAEYPSEWNPAGDERLPVWEALHHLIRILKTDGENGAGKVLADVAAKAEPTRQLAYRLYTLCERAGWAEDARAYNEIITSWSAIEAAAAVAPKARQADLFN